MMVFSFYIDLFPIQVVKNNGFSFYAVSTNGYISNFHDIIYFVSKQKLLLWFSTSITSSGYLKRYSDF